MPDDESPNSDQKKMRKRFNEVKSKIILKEPIDPWLVSEKILNLKDKATKANLLHYACEFENYELIKMIYRSKG